MLPNNALAYNRCVNLSYYYALYFFCAAENISRCQAISQRHDHSPKRLRIQFCKEYQGCHVLEFALSYGLHQAYSVRPIDHHGFGSPHHGSIRIHAYMQDHAHVLSSVECVCRVLRQVLRRKLGCCHTLEDTSPAVLHKLYINGVTDRLQQ